MDGKEVHFTSSGAAIAAGLGMVHQHFMLVPSFTVAQNIVMSREPRRLGVLFDNTAAAAAAQSAGAATVIAEDGTPDEAGETLSRQRADAKKAKNFAEADRIRDELKAQGIEVTDVPNGAKWKRI